MVKAVSTCSRPRSRTRAATTPAWLGVVGVCQRTPLEELLEVSGPRAQRKVEQGQGVGWGKGWVPSYLVPSPAQGRPRCLGPLYRAALAAPALSPRQPRVSHPFLAVRWPEGLARRPDCPRYSCRLHTGDPRAPGALRAQREGAEVLRPQLLRPGLLKLPEPPMARHSSIHRPVV